MVFGWFSKKISKYYLKRKDNDSVEFEEIAPFANNGGEKISTNGEKINKYSSIAAFLATGFVFVLLFQTFSLQVLDRSKFETLAENNRQKEVTTNADRGIIYDRNGNILVRNEAIFDLVGVGKEIPKDEGKLEEVINNIVLLTGKQKEEVEGAIKKLDRASRRPELLFENIGVSAAIEVETQKDKLPGIAARKNATRRYLDAEYFSQIIGYTGRVSPGDLEADPSYEPSDFAGKVGLESFYEQELRGKKGAEKTEVDAGGKAISIIGKTDAEAGNNLILSIDKDLQKKLQDTLQAQIGKIKGLSPKNGAAAVALDPRNGKILAMVSLPTYDNNIFVNPEGKAGREAVLFDPTSPMLNRVIGGAYPPGSTIKPVMGIAALTEKIVNEKTLIEDKGVIDIFYGNLVTHFYGWNRGGLGPMNIISALAQSSDIYFYTVGGGFGKFLGLGVDKITEYFRKFNLGKNLGIDLPGEVDGFVPSQEWKYKKTNGKDPWNLGNTYHLSIGQGYLLTTPLQVASWTEVFANGGTLYKPQIVDKITSGERGEKVEDIPSEVIKSNIADADNMDIIKRGMREVVLTGSGRALRSLPVSSGGKTGTAQYVSDGKEMTHAWFTAFAPYDNPEIVITVLIEGGGEGGIVSVPVAKEVLNWYFTGKGANQPEQSGYGLNFPQFGRRRPLNN